MVDSNTVSRIKIREGGSWFYYHDSCLDTADRLNVNNMSPEQQKRDRQYWKPVALEDVPDEMICSYCHKPIK